MIKSLLKLSFIIIIGLFLILGANSASFAAAIWSQAVDLTGGDEIDSYAAFSVPYFQMAADDWYCSDSTKDITGINWWGSYLEYSGQSSVMNTNISGFELFIIKDDGSGQPGGETKYSKLFSAANVNETYWGVNAGTGDSVFKNNIALLSDDFTEVGGTTYWLAVYAILNTGVSQTWGWNTSTDAWGNSAMITNDFGNWSTVGGAAPVNLAFELISGSAEEVPEPATMMLLGSLATGLFGFAGIKKKFRR